MAGTVERHFALTEPKLLPITHWVQIDALSQSLTQHAFAGVNSPIFAAAWSGMVCVGMGNQGSRNWSPRIDPGISSPAVQA